jgi:hypothetical protein
MRVHTTPEKATFAKVGEVEFKKQIGSNIFGVGTLDIDRSTLQAMGATFEMELEPEEGYRIVEPSEVRGLETCRYWKDDGRGWTSLGRPLGGSSGIYAIPIEQPKPSVVEGVVDSWSSVVYDGDPLPVGTQVLVIEKDKVLENYIDNGRRFLVVREG